MLVGKAMPAGARAAPAVRGEDCDYGVRTKFTVAVCPGTTVTVFTASW